FHTSHIQIRFADIDKLGHVNNAKYLTYFEIARMQFFEDEFKNISDLDWKTKGLILAKTEVEFIVPILLEDKVEIETFCTKIGNKSFDLAYRVFRINNQERMLAAKGSSVLVAFNYLEQKSIPVEESWKKELSRFLI
ncbi:MAG: acyl-CoA thioesterase, partial [Bacteroidia bacterium]